MSGRGLRPLKAAYLRRSRASPEVASEGDAPTPGRKSSPEDSRTNRHHLRRARRSPEERTPVCLAGCSGRKRAAHLRRSRASPEVTLGSDAPTPAREASPEDSRTNRRQLRRTRRSPEERTPERKIFGRRTTTAGSFLIY